MTITTLSFLLAVLGLAVPLAGEAQQAGRTYRIGVLEVSGESSNAANLGAFQDELRGLGYVEGENLVIEYRSADGRNERLADLATELVKLRVDAIVTRGEPAAIAAKHAAATIPIVMASSGDPAVAGIVASLARPGGNITGFHTMAPPEIGGKRLQLLKEAVPGVSRVGILWNSTDIYPRFLVRDAERVAGVMGLQLSSFEIRGPETFDRVFEAALLAKIDAFVAVEDYLTFNDRARVVDFAAMSRLPAIYGLREFVDAGGLMSYGTDRRDLFRRSTVYVHRILRGASPADLPVEAPTKFELAINLKAARALGLTIPPSLLRRADYILQ